MPRRLRTRSSSLAELEPTIAAAVRGGDSLLGWKSVWDVVQSTDADYKQQVLDALRVLVHSGPVAESERARAFADALAESNGWESSRDPKWSERVRIEESRRAMERIGVRPGEGIPMWALYMTRRSKRPWGA